MCLKSSGELHAVTKAPVLEGATHNGEAGLICEQLEGGIHLCGV